jgi:3-carboxy-cis,cis-muconate cycloisomerase
VREHLDAAAVENLLDPVAYTGLCADMAREAAGRARSVATELIGDKPARSAPM